MCIDYAPCDLSKFFVKSVENKDHSILWTVPFHAKEGTIQCTYGKIEIMSLLYSHYMRVISCNGYLHSRCAADRPSSS
ncbi:hypothetical protein IEQ34_026792 [Dendrobium chrysotoxum]|uniref:Uncharacterized protein n=1 Tax=Dendrobium chrysotoxum TaxID=161865 RepID=A0AAV7FLC2_DENCH|nr:hypothetical protein IEQ34_026792 [Dendrobium chrysotoxum]